MTPTAAHRAIRVFLSLVIGVLLLAVVSAVAYAEDGPRVELLLGQCQQRQSSDGIWYQTGYPYTFDLSSNCGVAGVAFPLTRKGGYGIGLRAAWVDLGTVRVASTFTMRDDEKPLRPSGAACVSSSMTGCVGRGAAEQTARGVSLGLTGERALGPVVLGAEAGGLLYYSRFTTSITAIPNPAAFAPIRFDWSGWQATPYAGLNARYGYAMVMLRAYGKVRAAEHGCGGCSGFANSYAVQALAGLIVPF